MPTPGYGLGQQTTAPVGVTRIPNTPGYFSAQTPGVFDSIDDGTRIDLRLASACTHILLSELPEEWVAKYKDKLVGNKPIVRLLNQEHWRLGGEQGVLLDVMIPRDDLEAEPTGTVVLWENGVQVGEPKSILAKDLRPVWPSQLGTTVVVFMGPLAGKQGIVRSIDDAEVFVVQLLEDQVIEDIQKDFMTLCVADNPFE